MKQNNVNTHKLLLWLVLALSIISVFFASQFYMSGQTSYVDIIDTRESLVAFNDLFNNYAKNYDVEGIVSLYADDALWIAPRTLPVPWKQASRETFWFLVSNSGSIVHTIDDLFISDDGSQAVMIWDAIVLVEKAGLDFTGTYKFVLKKIAGEWKIVSDMFNQHTSEDLSVN